MVEFCDQSNLHIFSQKTAVLDKKKNAFLLPLTFCGTVKAVYHFKPGREAPTVSRDVLLWINLLCLKLALLLPNKKTKTRCFRPDDFQHSTHKRSIIG